MRRYIFVMTIFQVASLALAVMFGLAFIDNVSVAMQWRPSNLGHEYRGWLPWFDWLGTLDLSTITTLIPSVVFLLLALGVRRIRRPHDNFVTEANFPLFKRHAEIAVGVGLIGTVIGLILFGYYKQEQVTLDDLTHCMRTALFSTIAALVWAYVLAPWICPLLVKWYNQTSSGVRENGKGLLEQFQELSRAVEELCQGFKGLLERLPGITAALPAPPAPAAPSGVDQVLAALKGICDQQAALLDGLRGELDEERKARREALQNERKALLELAAADRKKAAYFERRLKVVQGALDGVAGGDGHE